MTMNLFPEVKEHTKIGCFKLVLRNVFQLVLAQILSCYLNAEIELYLSTEWLVYTCSSKIL